MKNFKRHTKTCQISKSSWQNFQQTKNPKQQHIPKLKHLQFKKHKQNNKKNKQQHWRKWHLNKDGSTVDKYLKINFMDMVYFYLKVNVYTLGNLKMGKWMGRDYSTTMLCLMSLLLRNFNGKSMRGSSRKVMFRVLVICIWLMV